jgi:diguanylate cyclase
MILRSRHLPADTGLMRRRTLGVEFRFAVMAFVALVAAAVLIVASVRRDTMRRGEQNAVAQTKLVAQTVPPLVLTARDFRTPVSGSHLKWLDATFRKEVLVDGALRVKLYSPSGLITYSTRHDQIGKETDEPAETRHVIDGGIVSDVSFLDSEGGGGPHTKVTETYVPVSFDGGKPVGVLEIYRDYAPITGAVNSATWMIGVVLAGVLAVLYVGLLPLLRRLTRRLREQLATTEHIALHDGLTGLPNRLLFQDRATHAIEAARRDGWQLAVMLLDLNQFKEVNDTLGHEKGDRLLVDVAQRLRRALRGSDTIARLGGDEFGFVGLVHDEADAHAMARRLLDQLSESFEIDHLRLHVQGSIGIAMYPADGDDTETLLRKADVAMYAGKEQHVPVAYSPEHDHYSPERLELIGDLERAIQADELVLHFQPVADVRTGEVRMVEALVRWQHRDRGLLGPDEFVPLAEQTGTINLLTAAVLRGSLRQCAAWREEGHELCVAVNVAARDLANSQFPALVAAALDDAGLDASSLAIEISENTVLNDPVRMLAVLHELRDLGVTLAIDDFGAGHTSLSYLRKLPVDTLKIDRSFLTGLEDDGGNETIVHSAIELAHRLGLTVVAEGVETEYALARLDEFGCDLAQGYLLSRPRPAGELDPGAFAARV